MKVNYTDVSYKAITAIIDLIMVFFWVCTVLWLNVPKFRWPVLLTYSG